MVALRKCFAMVLALGTALAAPLVDDPQPHIVALEARPNSNPAAANLVVASNGAAALLSLGFTHLPINLSDQALQQMRDLITTKFLNWISTQDARLVNFWQGLVSGANSDHVYSTVQVQNNVVQYFMSVELHSGNSGVLNTYVVRILTAYLQNAGVQVHQTTGNLRVRDMAETEDPSESATARDVDGGTGGAPQCVRGPDFNPWQYASNNPPNWIFGHMLRWCH